MTAANVSRLPAPDPEPKGGPKKKAASSVAAAQEAEAGEGFVAIEQRGVKLRVPIAGKLPIAAVDAFRAGDNYEGTKAMLGDEQWQKLRDAGVTLEELDELGKKIEEAAGN